jgi:hypothetical protein
LDKPSSVVIDNVETLKVNMDVFETKGIFPGIVISILVVETIRFFSVKKLDLNFQIQFQLT